MPLLKFYFPNHIYFGVFLFLSYVYFSYFMFPKAHICLLNFVKIFQGALYFGVQMLLEKCKTWFSEVVSSKVPPQIGLDGLISMWNFGFDHGEDWGFFIILIMLCWLQMKKNNVYKTSVIDVNSGISGLTDEIYLLQLMMFFRSYVQVILQKILYVLKLLFWFVKFIIYFFDVFLGYYFCAIGFTYPTCIYVGMFHSL